jgi:hypothetical protein
VSFPMFMGGGLLLACLAAVSGGGHSSNRTTDNLQECPPDRCRAPQRIGTFFPSDKT